MRTYDLPRSDSFLRTVSTDVSDVNLFAVWSRETKETGLWARTLPTPYRHTAPTTSTAWRTWIRCIQFAKSEIYAIEASKVREGDNATGELPATKLACNCPFWIFDLCFWLQAST